MAKYTLHVLRKLVQKRKEGVAYSGHTLMNELTVAPMVLKTCSPFTNTV